MNVSFLISADGQTDGHYGYVECSREKGDTVRLVGLAILDSPHCSVHATSLQHRVLLKHVCELDWMGTLGRAGDRC